ncbi:MAG: hypothetical protein ABW034_09675 [Steroidobacteraceae bacterium]
MNRAAAEQLTLATLDKEWRTYVEPMLALAEHTGALLSDPKDPQQRAELYQQLFKTTSMSYLALFLGDPQHPDFWPIFNQAYSLGATNPDAAYCIAPLEGNGTYKISGFRGTVRMIDFQIGMGQFYPRGQGGLAPSIVNYDIDSLHIGNDSSFEVIASSKRPEHYTGDWWHLDPRATHVFVRQVAYDWLREVDGRLAIERLDRPAMRPRPSIQELQANLQQISSSAQNYLALSTGMLKRYLKEGLINRVTVRDLAGAGGFVDIKQLYIEGLIDIDDDEALIFEMQIPRRCRYWNLQTTDGLWNAVDYVNRQSSLNGHTARLDADGRFRAVISAHDPGVPNWLDTGGYRQGSVFGRLLECDSVPTPTVTRVRLADVREHLHSATPSITADQRDAALRIRRKGAQLRRRW